MGIIKLNGTEYTSINVQDVLVGGSSVVDPVTKVANVTVPTNTSDLTNDSGFIDSSALPTKVSELTNDSGFITDDDLIPTDESAVDEFTTLNGGLLQKCIINLEPVQSGSGTPAPDNVRPISGHTEVDIDIADENNVTQKSYQIQIGQTVYGGSLDVMTGVMTVTHEYIEYDGSADENWNVNTTNIPFFTIGRPNVTAGANIYSNEFESTVIYTSNSNIGVYASSNQLRVRPDLTTTTVNAFKTWLSNHPLQIAVVINTPQTIQLTPQQISTLIGKNYLSAPLSGQSIDSIEYRDVFGFDDVEKATSVRVPISLLGTDEFTSTSSKAYSAGDYFYKDGMMCKALTSIAKGATLTLNTNYSASTLADILKILSQ